ncbi:MAG: VOC family protein [Bacteroidetes bacterium]|nr:MAG: VOC family protein [Bacteroidota bacterium]
MTKSIAHIALVVDDYDKAIAFYTNILDFELIEDTRLSDEKRWVIVAPKGAKECSLLLAKAGNEKQVASIGNQTGGRVFLFLFTDNIKYDYDRLCKHGITFIRHPQQQEHGVVAVFEDLYGNLWDLIEPNEQNRWHIHREKDN